MLPMLSFSCLFVWSYVARKKRLSVPSPNLLSIKNNTDDCKMGFFGWFARVLGFGVGIVKGSFAALFMSFAWTWNIGRGVVSKFQSAGARYS